MEKIQLQPGNLEEVIWQSDVAVVVGDLLAKRDEDRKDGAVR
jgi:hypothetical protein